MLASTSLRGPTASDLGISGSLYLLSALFMMIGCYTVARSLELQAGEVGGLIVMLAVLNCYEALLIGLGLYLFLRGRRAADGALLLILEGLFLVDAAYLGSELISARPAVGAYWAAGLLTVAVAKLVTVVQVLQIRLAAIHWISVVLGLTLLAALPAWLGWRSGQREVSELDVYFGWWAVAAVVALHGLGTFSGGVGQRRREVRAWLRGTFAATMLISLIGHLVALGWVYHVPLRTAYVAPLILAAVPWICRFWPGLGRELALPALAVVCALSVSPGLTVTAGTVTVTPLRLTLLAAAACYIGITWLRRRWTFAIAAVVAVCVALLGQTPAEIWAVAQKAWSQAVSALRTHVPRGGLFWGCVSVAAAFGLLAAGAILSLRGGGRRKA
jgi:hypothetical protein